MNSTAVGQGKLKHAPPFLFILFAAAFTYGLIRLFSLQFASGIVGIILVALAIGLHELWTHQLHRVAELLYLARPVVCRAHASIPTRQGSSFASKPSKCLRVTHLCTSVFPRMSTPCTPNTSFARSMPIVLIFILGPSSVVLCRWSRLPSWPIFEAV